jgi:uncharacterized protein YukE
MDERLKRLLMMDYATKNQGGGLFGNQEGGGLFGNFANINPNLLLGSMIAGSGVQGKDPFSSFAPALMKTGQLQGQFLKMNEMKKRMELAEKQRNFFEDLPDDHPFKELAEAFPGKAATGIIEMHLKNIDQIAKDKKDKENKISELLKNIQDQENKLFTAYQGNKVVQDFDQSTQAITKLLKGLEANDGAGDVAAVFTFMKTLDPNSVVREGEFATAENTAGHWRKFWNLHNKLLRGERLTDEQRDSFKNLGINLYQQNQKAVDNVRYNFTQIADNQGLNIDNIFVDSDIRPKYESVVEMAAPGAEQTTKTERVPAGAILVDYFDGKYYFKIPGRRKYLVTDGFK